MWVSLPRTAARPRADEVVLRGAAFWGRSFGAGRGAGTALGVRSFAFEAIFPPNTFNKSAVLLCFCMVWIVWTVWIVWRVSPVWLYSSRFPKRHKGDGELEHFFAGSGIEGFPALANGVLVTFARAQMHRDDRRADVLAAFLDQAPEQGVPPHLIEKHPDDRIGVLDLNEFNSLGGLPDVGRRGGRDDDCNIGGPHRRRGRLVFPVGWRVVKLNIVFAVRRHAPAAHQAERSCGGALSVPILDRDRLAGLLERFME